MTEGRDLPWLQDETGEVTTSWQAAYRDFVILDPANAQPMAAYNLSLNPLELSDNYQELKAILLDLAVLRDGDTDGVSDYWEEEVFNGSVVPMPTDDGDGDQADALLEYAFASSDDDPASLPLIDAGILTAGEDQFHTVSFRRRLGASGGLSYVLEIGSDLSGWAAATAGELIEVGVVNPYDGTGTEIVTLRSALPITSMPAGQIRVRVELP